MKIEVTIKISGIHAIDYEQARDIAWLHFTADRNRMLLLEQVGAGWKPAFFKISSVAKELNGTYTVTIP